MIKISDTEYFSNDKTIRFLNMDCNVFMAGCKDNEFDLNLSDPPYFNGPNKLGYYGAVKSKTKVKRQSYNVIGVWEVPKQGEFNEYIRVSKNQIIWGGNYFIDNLHRSENIIAWDKQCDKSDFSDFEMAWTSFSKANKIFRLPIQSESQCRIHPTQKPIALYKWILKNYAKEGDTILDTHLGSGSSAIAAHDGGFEFTGIELDEEYYKLAKDRIIMHQRQLNLFR